MLVSGRHNPLILLVIAILFISYCARGTATQTYKHHGSFSGLPPSHYRFYCCAGYRLWEQGFDLRVTLDAGMTSMTADKDRLGLAINRASRIEKVQAGNIEVRGQEFEQLRARNRCIVTEEMRKTMITEQQGRCQHVGACKLKGFGDDMHQIFQYQV